MRTEWITQTRCTEADGMMDGWHDTCEGHDSIPEAMKCYKMHKGIAELKSLDGLEEVIKASGQDCNEERFEELTRVAEFALREKATGVVVETRLIQRRWESPSGYVEVIGP